MDELDIEQAAKRLGRSTKTIRRWVHANRINYHVRDGKYLFSLEDLEAKRTEASPDRMDNLALLERIETLEKRVEELEHQAQKQPAVLRPAPAPYETSRPAPPRPTRLVHDGGALPEGLISFRSMAKAHNIAESTAQRAIESGRLDVVRGHWKHGRAIVQQALDAAGQRRFVELFESNLGWKPCPRCPHDVTGTQ